VCSVGVGSGGGWGGDLFGGVGVASLEGQVQVPLAGVVGWGGGGGGLLFRPVGAAPLCGAIMWGGWARLVLGRSGGAFGVGVCPRAGEEGLGERGPGRVGCPREPRWGGGGGVRSDVWARQLVGPCLWCLRGRVCGPVPSCPVFPPAARERPR